MSDMLNKTKVLKALKTFNQYIDCNLNFESNTKSMGALTGVSSVILFKFYYARLLKDESIADQGADVLAECIDEVNNGFTYPTYCNGLAGLGWLIDHLEYYNFIDVDSDELLVSMDDYLHQQMILYLNNKEYDKAIEYFSKLN